MALVLNEEQGMLRDSVIAFLSERAPVAHLRKLERQQHTDDAEGAAATKPADPPDPPRRPASRRR